MQVLLRQALTWLMLTVDWWLVLLLVLLLTSSPVWDICIDWFRRCRRLGVAAASQKKKITICLLFDCRQFQKFDACGHSTTNICIDYAINITRCRRRNRSRWRWFDVAVALIGTTGYRKIHAFQAGNFSHNMFDGANFVRLLWFCRFRFKLVRPSTARAMLADVLGNLLKRDLCQYRTRAGARMHWW